MTTSKHEEQAERLETLRNDADVLKQQGGTFFEHALEETIPRGRFGATGVPQIVGQTPAPSYPAASAHQRDPVPDEPPLEFKIDES
jgi:hypothetical protein